MTAFDTNAFITFLQSKWKDKPCPMCGAASWNIQGIVFQILEFSGGNLRIGGPVIPVVPVACGNCGNTVLVNAILSGMVKAETPTSA